MSKNRWLMFYNDFPHNILKTLQKYFQKNENIIIRYLAEIFWKHFLAKEINYVVKMFSRYLKKKKTFEDCQNIFLYFKNIF